MMEEQKKSWVISLLDNIKLELFISAILTVYACYLYRVDKLNLISVIILAIIWSYPIISILMKKNRKKKKA